MASKVLAWGKPTIKTTTSTNGAPATSATWKEIDTPKEDTTTLSTSAGDVTNATIEGGEIIASRYDRNTYTLEFDLWYADGTTLPFESNDGVISGEHAFRIISEAEDGLNVQIDRAVVRAEENYTSADGIIMHYVVSVLKPASGNSVKIYSGDAPSA